MPIVPKWVLCTLVPSIPMLLHGMACHGWPHATGYDEQVASSECEGNDSCQRSCSHLVWSCSQSWTLSLLPSKILHLIFPFQSHVPNHSTAIWWCYTWLTWIEFVLPISFTSDRDKLRPIFCTLSTTCPSFAATSSSKWSFKWEATFSVICLVLSLEINKWKWFRWERVYSFPSGDIPWIIITSKCHPFQLLISCTTPCATFTIIYLIDGTWCPCGK